MSDDGYTLAETLAALAILGLAIGGLGVVVSLIARQQLSATRLHDRLADARAADRALQDLTADADLSDLVGDVQSLSFACGAAQRCVASLEPTGRRTLLVLRDRQGANRRLRLRALGLGFSYVGLRGPVAAWPASKSTEVASPGAAPLAPTAIVLRAAVGAPLSVIRPGRREPRDCQYDVIAGGCRAVKP